MSGVFRYLAAITWLGATGVGLAGLWRYSLTPAEMSAGTAAWPKQSCLEPPGDRPSLVLFLHPECPCSRATVTELGRLLARQPGKLSVQVVFYTPEEKSAEWERSALRGMVQDLPEVRSLTDTNGREAALFGAQTSGETMVYDTAGRLIFHGGMTGARGHEGDNAGLDAVEAMAATGSSFVRTAGENTPAGSRKLTVPTVTPVFGCSLGNREADGPRSSAGSTASSVQN